jgi:hypothetical protein
MRPALLCSILMMALVALEEPACAWAGRWHRPPPPPPAVDMPTWEVTGRGTTRADAEKDALDQASSKIAEYLATECHETVWTPTPAYLKQWGLARPAGEPKQMDLAIAGPATEVTMTVELSQDALKDMLREARELRMRDRQPIAFRWLAGMVVALLVAFGYLRLEEATKGYYTTLLRLTALTVVAAAGVFLWKYPG